MGFDFSKLGVKKNIPKVDFREYSGLIQSESKWGKTQLVATLPNTILVAFEKGYDAQVLDFIDCCGDDGWDKFVVFINNLVENREEIGNEIRLIALDTLEEMYSAVEPYMLKKESIKDKVKYAKIGDIPYGAGYALKDDYFRKEIKRIYNLGFRPIYLTHVEMKTVKPKDGDSYNVYVPTVPERCSKIVYPEVSYIIHGKRDTVDGKKVRVLQVQGNDETVAGNRVYFDENIVFDSEEEAVEKFDAKFKEMIKQRLVKAGITEDIDSIAKKQEAEKSIEVKESLQKIKELPELIKEIKKLMKELITTKKIDNAGVVAILRTNSLETPDSIVDVETAKVILEALNEKK